MNPPGTQLGLPISVVFALLFPAMHSPLELDNEPGLCAVEVHDESKDRVLAPEMQSVQRATAQMFPEQSLLGGTPLP